MFNGISAAQLYGFVAWLVIGTAIVAYLARRKSSTPVLTTCIGAVAMFVIPIGLIMIARLALKPDLRANDA